jgi:hypothetical protein
MEAEEELEEGSGDRVRVRDQKGQPLKPREAIGIRYGTAKNCIVRQKLPKGMIGADQPNDHRNLKNETRRPRVRKLGQKALDNRTTVRDNTGTAQR